MKQSISFINNGAESDLKIYSSDQWFKCIDRIIASIVASLIEHTSLVEHYVSQLIVYQHANKKRRISIEHKWEEAIERMLYFLERPTSDNFQDIVIDRGFAQTMIFGFNECVAGYMDTYSRVFDDPIGSMRDEYWTLDDYHKRVGKKANVRDLLCVINHVSYMTSEMEQFRNMILTNYAKYIVGLANSDSSNSPLMTSRENLRQIYYLAANKAINHYNPKRGTFKPYLDLWIKKYRNSSSSFRNLAFSAPNGVRANNFYVSLDSTDSTQDSFRNDSRELVYEERAADYGYSLERLTQLASVVDKEQYTLRAMGLA